MILFCEDVSSSPAKREVFITWPICDVFTQPLRCWDRFQGVPPSGRYGFELAIKSSEPGCRVDRQTDRADHLQR